VRIHVLYVTPAAARMAVKYEALRFKFKYVSKCDILANKDCNDMF